MSGSGKLPSFLVIGAAKAGTTALYRYLGQHPKIYLSRVKEPRFFICEDGVAPEFSGPGDDGFSNGIVADEQAYRALFQDVEGEPAVGEMSPTYLYWPGTAERIAAALPGARLVAILRDPVERAFSNYLMHVRARIETLTFEEALDAEEQRIRKAWGPSWHYEARGYYARQLRPYLERFDPEQVLLLFHHDLRSRPAETFRRIFEFLDVDADFVPDTSRRPNQSLVPRSRRLAAILAEPGRLGTGARALVPRGLRARVRRRLTIANQVRPTLERHVRARLVERYASDIESLERIAQRDLSAWRRA